MQLKNSMDLVDILNFFCTSQKILENKNYFEQYGLDEIVNCVLYSKTLSNDPNNK